MNANGSTQTQELKRMSANGNRLPPGPKGLPLVGVSFNLLQDPLELMRRVTREYGDIVRIPVILAKPHPAESSGFHPASAAGCSKQISQEHADEGNHRAPAGARSADQRRRFLAAARRLAQPAFHRHRINEYAPTMVECAEMQCARLARRRYTQHGGRNDGADARGRRADSFRHHASRRGATSGPRA